MTSLHTFHQSQLTWALDKSSRECLELTVGPQSIDSHALLGDLDLFVPFLEGILSQVLQDPNQYLASKPTPSSASAAHPRHLQQTVSSIKIHLEGFEFLGDPPTLLRDIEVPLSDAKEAELLKKHLALTGADLLASESKSTKLPPRKALDRGRSSSHQQTSIQQGGNMYKPSDARKDFIFPSPRRSMSVDEQVAAVMSRLTNGLFCTSKVSVAPIRATPKFFREQRDLSSAVHPSLSLRKGSNTKLNHNSSITSSLNSSTSSSCSTGRQVPPPNVLTGVQVTFTFQTITDVPASFEEIKTSEQWEAASPATSTPSSFLAPTTSSISHDDADATTSSAPGCLNTTTVDEFIPTDASSSGEYPTPSATSGEVKSGLPTAEEEQELISELSEDDEGIVVSPPDSRSHSLVPEGNTHDSAFLLRQFTKTRKVSSYSSLRVTTIPITAAASDSFLKRELLLAHQDFNESSSSSSLLKSSYFQPSLQASHCVILCQEDQRQAWKEFLDLRRNDPSRSEGGDAESTAPTDDSALLLQHLKRASANELNLKGFVSTLEAKVQALEIQLDINSQEKGNAQFQIDALNDDLSVVYSKNQALEALLFQKQAAWDIERGKLERRILEGSSASISSFGGGPITHQEGTFEDRVKEFEDPDRRLASKLSPIISAPTTANSAPMTVQQVEQLTSSLQKELKYLKTELQQYRQVAPKNIPSTSQGYPSSKSSADVGVQVVVLDRIRRW